MTIKKILLMGHPDLLKAAKTVESFDTPELHSLIQDLEDTLQAEDGVGLAAPQIAVNLRVVVFGFEHNCRYPAAPSVPKTVLINPLIVPLESTDCAAQDLSDPSDQVLSQLSAQQCSKHNATVIEQELDWEGCLSVPGLRGMVPRYKTIVYSGYDVYGEKVERIASGFHARVVQHECDHLNGILYPQRMTDMQSFGFIEALGPPRVTS